MTGCKFHKRLISLYILLAVALIGFGACGCSRCDEAPVPPDPAPAQAQEREPLEVVDGDRVTPREAPPELAEPLVPAEVIAYPPDAQPFQDSLTREGVKVVRFPEYSDRERFSSHAYAILSPADRHTLILDPGIGSVRMIRFWAEREGADVRVIAVTHGHLDHTGGVGPLKETWPEALFVAPKDDADWMQEMDLLHFGGLRASPPPPPDRLLVHGDLIRVGNLVFDVIATPGHTKGSICLYLPEENLLFSGDTLFYRNIGRTNFPQSLTLPDLIQSIRSALGKLPDDTLVFPGHGWPTNLGDERRENPYLTGVPLPPVPPVEEAAP